MLRSLLALAATLSLGCHVQHGDAAKALDHSDLPAALAFELAPTRGIPGGWGGGPSGAIFADSKIVHGGKWSARIEGHPESASSLFHDHQIYSDGFLGQIS